MKKIIFALLILVLTFGVVSCNGEVDEKLFGSETSSSSISKEPCWTVKLTHGSETYYSNSTNFKTTQTLYLDEYCTQDSGKKIGGTFSITSGMSKFSISMLGCTPEFFGSGKPNMEFYTDRIVCKNSEVSLNSTNPTGYTITFKPGIYYSITQP